MVLQTENAHQKKIPAGYIPTDFISSVIVAYPVNIFQLSV